MFVFDKEKEIDVVLSQLTCAIAVSGNRVIVYGKYNNLIGLLKTIRKHSKPFKSDVMARRLMDLIREEGKSGFSCVSDGNRVDVVIDGSELIVQNIMRVIDVIALEEGRERVRKDLVL